MEQIEHRILSYTVFLELLLKWHQHGRDEVWFEGGRQLVVFRPHFPPRLEAPFFSCPKRASYSISYCFFYQTPPYVWKQSYSAVKFVHGVFEFILHSLLREITPRPEVDLVVT